MPNALVIDESGLARLQLGIELDVDWYSDFSTVPGNCGLSRVRLGETVYLLGPEADSDSRLLVIDLTHGFFSELEAKRRPEAFLRLVRAARSAHEPARLPIPTSWSPYNVDSRISFQSNHRASGERARIEMDVNPRGTTHTYAFSINRDKKDLRVTVVDYTCFDKALKSYEDAVLQMLSSVGQETRSNGTTVVLGLIEDPVSLGRSTKDWLEGKLTQEQRAFISHPLERSIRLVGAAGTGKTLSLVLKCLVEYGEAGAREQGFRCLFLTHNQSTIEAVTKAIASMDHESVISRWPQSLLKVCTLQELANEAMKYDLHGLEPLSNDGFEGRMLQLEAIEAQIDAYRRSDWLTHKARCNAEFQSDMEAERGSQKARTFALELMNEFACVLEADGVRQSAERRSKYLSEKRRGWMMPLHTSDERQVVLELYDLFRALLRDMGTIGVDQMIADYLGFLDSNRWDSLRSREGYDAVFVDELHLFNRQERMTLHHLMRDPSRPPVVVMAYDSKQSPRDTFYGLVEQSNGRTVFARDMRLGETERFELNEAFRYTPEIAQVLEWIDQSFPAAGISDELGPDWRKYTVKANTQSGARPLIVQGNTTVDIYRKVFPRAQSRARELGKGRRVAVLCVSEQAFKRYIEAGEYKDLCLPITDREQLASLQHAGKRFVLSMPDFVAGIQFDTVYLIEANDGEVPQSPYATSQLRRFVSQIYLGASRAEKRLEIYASKERGGISRAFRHVIAKGALDVTTLADLD